MNGIDALIMVHQAFHKNTLNILILRNQNSTFMMNLLILHNLNFMMTGMQNMMAGGRRKKKSWLTIQPCIAHFFCTLRSRRYKMNQPKELGLKTLK